MKEKGVGPIPNFLPSVCACVSVFLRTFFFSPRVDQKGPQLLVGGQFCQFCFLFLPSHHHDLYCTHVSVIVILVRPLLEECALFTRFVPLLRLFCTDDRLVKDVLQSYLCQSRTLDV